ncbi:hypothetical protein ACO1O0_007606 [Amphichorda felina]
MRFTAFLLAPLLAATTTQAAEIKICRKIAFFDCTVLTVPSGQCAKVPDDFNNQVSSAKVLKGNYCESYDIPCEGSPLIKITHLGFSALPKGQKTSGFRCYD